MTESTDRELIELAAKAAGIELMPEVDWNPIESDADAFRLAVKLGLVVYIKEPIESSSYTVVLGNSDEELIESHGSDPYAATRRAITRAAAEIGKAM